MISAAESAIVAADHVVNALGLSGVFIIFMIPSMIIVFTAAYLWEERKKKKKKSEQEKKNKAEADKTKPVIHSTEEYSVIITDKYKAKDKR